MNYYQVSLISLTPMDFSKLPGFQQFEDEPEPNSCTALMELPSDWAAELEETGSLHREFAGITLEAEMP